MLNLQLQKEHVQFPVLLWHGIWEANHVWVVRTSSVDTTGCTHVNASLDISSVKTPKSWCTMQTPEIYAQVLCFGGPNEKTCQWWVEDGWGWLCLWWLSWSSWIPSKRQRGLSPIKLWSRWRKRCKSSPRRWRKHVVIIIIIILFHILYACVYCCEFSILIWWLPITSMPWLSPFSSRFFLVVSMFFCIHCIHTHKWFT